MPETPRQQRGASLMRNVLLFVAIIAAWIVLQRWVLPWLGVPT